MASNLSPENEAFLAELLASHEYSDREAALDEAVRLFRRRRRLLSAVTAGIDQLNQGKVHAYERDDLARFLADIESREKQLFPGE